MEVLWFYGTQAYQANKMAIRLYATTPFPVEKFLPIVELNPDHYLSRPAQNPPAMLVSADLNHCAH